MKKEIITYTPTLDDEYYDGNETLGIDEIAFTANPAIKIKGVAFSSEEKQKFFSDEIKMRIAAPVLTPTKIYRRATKDMDEHYINFTQEETEAIFKDFMRRFNEEKKHTGLFNDEHDSSNRIPAYLLEIWLVDNPKNDKSYTTFGILCPKGTIFAVAQFTNKEVYDELVKSDKLGFSIEAFLGLKLSNKTKNNTMKIRIYSNEKKVNLSQIKSIQKWATEVDQEIIELGVKLTTSSNFDSGNPQIISAGEYDDEAGRRFLVDSGGIVRLFIDNPIQATAEYKSETVSMSEQPSGEEIKKEEEMSEQPSVDNGNEQPVDEKNQEMEGTFTPEQLTMINDVVDAKIKEKTDELTDMIAELKSLVEGETEQEVIEGDVQMSTVKMSANDRIAAIRDFLKVINK